MSLLSSRPVPSFSLFSSYNTLSFSVSFSVFLDSLLRSPASHLHPRPHQVGAILAASRAASYHVGKVVATALLTGQLGSTSPNGSVSEMVSVGEDGTLHAQLQTLNEEHARQQAAQEAQLDTLQRLTAERDSYAAASRDQLYTIKSLKAEVRQC